MFWQMLKLSFSEYWTLIIRANQKNIFDLILPSILTLHNHLIQFTETVAYYGLESRL